MKRLLLACAALLAVSTDVDAAPRFFGTTSIQAGDTVANTTTATVLTTKLVMPPTENSGTYAGTGDVRNGQTFVVDAYCTLGTLGSSQGTLKLDVIHLTGASGTTVSVLGTTGAFTPPAGLAANTNYLHIHGHVVYNVTGNGTGIAAFFGDTTLEGASNASTVYPMIPASMASGGTSGWTGSLTTTQNPINAVALQVTWSVASASNTITCASYYQRVA